MTTTLEAPPREDFRSARAGLRPQLPFVAISLAALLLRLPFITRPLSPDEAGFSIVAGHWHPGTSLYGAYWVDRPPLLIALFEAGGLLDDLLGNPIGIRVVGCFATLVAVLAVGLTGRVVAGQRAGVGAAVMAAVGLGTPTLGALSVNGELLAAPFIAVSILCWVLVLQRSRRTSLWAFASGASALAAVLVKQNMIDGVVFVMMTLLCARVIEDRVLSRLPLGRWVLGASTSTSIVLAYARLRGSTPAEIWFAMYPFRIRAAAVQHGSWAERLTALGHLGMVELASLGPLVIVAFALVTFRERAASDSVYRLVGPGLLCLIGYDVVSIAAGGSYWAHYLVQLVIPVALAAGVLLTRTELVGRHLVSLAATIALIVWLAGLAGGSHSPGRVVGSAIRRAAAPGDTIVSVLGDADIVATSGLQSNYRYLWSLPARTLDNRFDTLADLLSDPNAPTWLVIRGSRTYAMVMSTAVGPEIDLHYHRVADLCGRLIFVSDTVSRGTPAAATACS